MPLIQMSDDLRAWLVIGSYLGLALFLLSTNLGGRRSIKLDKPWPVVIGVGGSLLLYFLLLYGTGDSVGCTDPGGCVWGR